MALQLETRGPGAGKPSLEEALKRNAFTAHGVLGIVPLIGGVGRRAGESRGGDRDRGHHQQLRDASGLHDTFAGGTSVVEVG